MVFKKEKRRGKKKRNEEEMGVVSRVRTRTDSRTSPNESIIALHSRHFLNHQRSGCAFLHNGRLTGQELYWSCCEYTRYRSIRESSINFLKADLFN